jgi:hypothetical protein
MEKARLELHYSWLWTRLSVVTFFWNLLGG